MFFKKMFIKKIGLILISFCILTVSNDLLGTETKGEDLNFLADKNSDVYKCVSYNIDQNINIASDLYGKNYWAYKAITDREDPFYSSIEILKQIVTFMYKYTIKEKCCVSDKINITLFFTKYFVNGFFDDSTSEIDGNDYSSKSLDDPVIKSIFGKINFLSVFYGIYFCFIRNEYNFEKVWKLSIREVDKELKLSKLQSGMSLYEYLVAKFNNEQDFKNYIKHDWMCYLQQFNVLFYNKCEVMQSIYNNSVCGKLLSLFYCNLNQIKIFEAKLRYVNYFNLKQMANHLYNEQKNKNGNCNKEALLLEKFRKDVSSCKEFCFKYNELLQKHGFYDSVYKINNNDYDFDYIFVLKELRENNKDKAFSSDEFLSIAEKSIIFTKKLIDEGILINTESRLYGNPKVIFKIMCELKNFKPYKKTLTVFYQLFKRFSELQLTNVFPSVVRNIVFYLLRGTNKSIEELADYTKRKDAFRTTKDFSKLIDEEEIKKFFEPSNN